MLESDLLERAVPAFEAAMSIAVEDPIMDRAAHTRLGMVLAKTLETRGT